MADIQAEFDRIALASKDQRVNQGWNHNDHYHDFLLNQLPVRIGSALDIGCGTGTLARQLAARADHVLALDLSPEMLRQAQEHSMGYAHIDYQQADVLAWEWPVNAFDCIASIATLHHLPLETVLPKIKAALRPGGTLLILDLYQIEGITDLFRNALAIPLNIVYRLAIKGRRQDSPAMQAAWEKHLKDDAFPRVSEVKRICASILPGSQVRKHLFWRYSLVWKKN
jgi:2-polyprenyl-3-methyl-5-hydroxy-6-metoxy-1,4-benzoquinol methylase